MRLNDGVDDDDDGCSHTFRFGSFSIEREMEGGRARLSTTLQQTRKRHLTLMRRVRRCAEIDESGRLQIYCL